MRTTSTTALLLAVPVVVAAQQPLSIDAVTLAAPAPLATIDLDRMKGQPARLSWSPDGTRLYLQMMEGDFGLPPRKLHHHTFTASDGARENAEAEPDWATDYWTVKSGQNSPDGPPLRIDLREEVKTAKTTSTPMGGALARGGIGGDAGTSTGDALNAAYNQQQVRVISTVLHDTVIGIFEGTVLLPGRTFGWGPPGSRAITYVDPKNGRVMVMDEKGGKRDIPGSKDAILPAWSPDGGKIAWLQRDGKKKYVLHVARVAGS
jgi:hypothetical protein